MYAPEESREPDEFEVHARTWRAQHEIAQNMADFCRRMGLDPELAERLHEAAVEDADHRDTLDALADIQRALLERLEDDPTFAARRRDACAKDPSLGEAIVRFFAGVIQAMENLEALEEDDEEDEDFP